jgi:hypothetical protein
MNKPCEYCGCDLPLGVDKKTRQHRSHHFATCKARPVCEVEPPAQQEPVVLPCCGFTDARAVRWNFYNKVVQCHNCGQVYTFPPAQRTWVALTDEEIERACVPLGAAMLSFTEVARAIEAKLKEKNT